MALMATSLLLISVAAQNCKFYCKQSANDGWFRQRLCDPAYVFHLFLFFGALQHADDAD
jgi:hypothetical protein